MSRGLREIVTATGIAAVLAVVFTWPLAPEMGQAGRIDSGDGRFSVWNVAWVARTLTTDPRHLFDANIFYPDRGALAFSEPNILAGVLAIPVWVTTHNALAAANFVTLLSFVLSFVSMFALARRLAGTRAAAALSATLFSFSAYTFSHLPHVQLLMTFGLPLSLLALHHFVAAPGRRTGIWLGVALFVQGLACGYYGVFSALAVGWGLVWFGVMDGIWRQTRYWGFAALAACIAAAAIWPFFVRTLDVQAQGFGRTLDDARMFSAGWRAYLASPMLATEWMLPLIGGWEAVLFTGFLGIALSIVATVRTFGRWRRQTPIARGVVVGYYLTLAGLAMWASFGPNAGLYRVLYDIIPVFSLLRAPRRFGLFVTLVVALLSGVGLADLQRYGAAKRRSVIVFVVLVLALVRSTVGPLDLIRWDRQSVAYSRLAQMPMGAVAEFPFFSGPEDRHRHTEYMLGSTLHWHPLINGYSDYIPDQALAEMPVLATFPSEAAWAVLHRRGARYIVMHWNMYPPGASPHAFVRSRLVGSFLRTVVDNDQAALYEIARWPDVGAPGR